MNDNKDNGPRLIDIVVLLLFAVGERLFDRKTGFLAAALLASTGTCRATLRLRK